MPHLDGGVGGGVADADGAAAHRGRDIAAVEVSHGASFFFCLELQVSLESGERRSVRCEEVQVGVWGRQNLVRLGRGTVPLLVGPGPGV